jgi:UDP-GlcNAc:undecaprenyl-phosphate GlcNAc-1-phosphate transferase
MIITNSQYFLLFATSFVLVGVLTPLMRKVAVSKAILDYPNSSHKSHSLPTPYLGGVAIILGVVTITYSALLYSDFTLNNFWLATSLLGPAVAMGLIGLWDDIKQLSPLFRFMSQTIAGLVVSISLVSSDNLGNPTGLTTLDVFISIIWVIGICNSINFFDNLDGGAAGTSAITALALFFIAVNSGQIFIASLSIVLAGSTLGFLKWNIFPARIYMGDAGALFLGVLLATLTIRLNPSTNSIMASFSIPILLLAVPILDTSIAVLSRLIRKISPFQGGKDHLSHRLIRSGFSRRFTVIFLWSLSTFFCLTALYISVSNVNNENNVLLIPFLAWVVLFFVFIKSDDT